MALDAILGDQTYPEFDLKLTQSCPKTFIRPLEALIRHQTRKFDLAHEEQPQAGIKSLGLVFWDILASYKIRGNMGHPDSE